MRIIFTHHAENKLKDLANLGVNVTKSLIEDILNNPLHIDTESDYPNKIASGKLGERHLLRVVFREEDGIIMVITFYPARKGRYL